MVKALPADEEGALGVLTSSDATALSNWRVSTSAQSTSIQRSPSRSRRRRPIEQSLVCTVRPSPPK